MAESGGHWANLAAAQKLTQSMKIPGVFEEDIKRNNPLERLTVGQAAHSGLKIEWLREKPAAVSAIEAAVPHGRSSRARRGRDKGAWGDLPIDVTNAWSQLAVQFDELCLKHKVLEIKKCKTR